MLKSKILLACFLFVCVMVNSQTFFSHSLEGKVVSETKDVADVHVLNITTKKATITNAYGYFSIPIKLNDTILFSAVQFKKKQLVVTASILKSKIVYVTLEEVLNVLDEVVVTPYNLSGDIGTDVENLEIQPIVTASTLGLPNANVKPLMQSERLLREASIGPFSVGMLTSIPFNPLINAISGRTKMLKKRVARDKKYIQTERVRKFYADSLYVTSLRIPEVKIDDFMYFCEVDIAFEMMANTNDRIQIWGFLRKKSVLYRENNDLE